MKTGIAICLTVTIVWAILAILQLWFTLLSGDVFMKVSITAAVIVGVVLIVTLAIREYISDKELKAKGFID